MFTNFLNLRELHLTNAFTENIDSKYYLDDLATMIMAALAEGVNNLTKLYLGQNEIWSIKNEMFCSDLFPVLSHLDLSNNQLNDLKFKFECIKKLTVGTYFDYPYNVFMKLDIVPILHFGSRKIKMIFIDAHHPISCHLYKVLIFEPFCVKFQPHLPMPLSYGKQFCLSYNVVLNTV